MYRIKGITLHGEIRYLGRISNNLTELQEHCIQLKKLEYRDKVIIYKKLTVVNVSTVSGNEIIETVY